MGHHNQSKIDVPKPWTGPNNGAAGNSRWPCQLRLIL